MFAVICLSVCQSFCLTAAHATCRVCTVIRCSLRQMPLASHYYYYYYYYSQQAAAACGLLHGWFPIRQLVKMTDETHLPLCRAYTSVSALVCHSILILQAYNHLSLSSKQTPPFYNIHNGLHHHTFYAISLSANSRTHGHTGMA